MKKTVILLVVCALFLCSCGTSFTVDVKTAGASMADASGYMWVEYDSDSIYNDTGISEDMYSSVFFAWLLEASVGNCACVILFEGKDEKDAETLSEYLNAYLADVRLTQEKYNADNYEMTKQAQVKTEQNYVYLVISPDNDLAYKAFENAKTAE